MLDKCAILGEAFSDSGPPYRVDIVDWRAIDDRFRALIDAERVPMTD